MSEYEELAKGCLADAKTLANSKTFTGPLTALVSLKYASDAITKLEAEVSDLTQVCHNYEVEHTALEAENKRLQKLYGRACKRLAEYNELYAGMSDQLDQLRAFKLRELKKGCEEQYLRSGTTGDRERAVALKKGG